MTWITKRTGALLSLAVGLLLTEAASAQLSRVIDAERTRIRQAQAAQDQIDEIFDSTQEKFEEWQRLLKEIENYRTYNDGLQSRIDDQNRVLDELRDSIDQVTVVERQIMPLMVRMIDGLEQFVALDVPFLLDQRTARVERLRGLLTRSDVSTAEQFRNTMEAWQIEMDYGRFAESYSDIIEIGGVSREVSIFKVGRVALLYTTPDRQQAGMWDQAQRQWLPIDSSYVSEIETGMTVIGGGAPEIFAIPIAPAEDQ